MLTVISKTAHDLAFAATAAIVGVAGDAIADTVLSRSPTRRHQVEVERTNRRLFEKRERLSAAKTEVEADRRFLRKQSEAMEAERQFARKAYQELEAEHGKLKARHSDLGAEHGKLKRSNEALQKDHAVLQTTTAKRTAAVKAVLKKLNTTLVARSAEAITSFPARAMPYLGIGVLVATTTYEIKMNCDLERELSSLLAVHEETLKNEGGSVCSLINKVPSTEQVWSSVLASTSSTTASLLRTLEALR